MCKMCDNPEGNMCRKCERELADVKRVSLYDEPMPVPDPWWPRVSPAVLRSINSVSGSVPEGFLYV